MIGSVVTPANKRKDWPAIRRDVLRRVQDSMGRPAAPLARAAARWEEVERYRHNGMTHIRFRYHVIDEYWNEGVCVLPEKTPAPAILTIHGTNGKQGKRGMLIHNAAKPRAYAIELARRGYVACAVDQFGFGATIDKEKPQTLYERFYRRHPDWSLDARRILDHTRVLDVLERLDFVRGKAFGAIGNSLGGRAVIYLAALEKRVKAAVVSTGISPNASNVFRWITRDRLLSPRLSRKLEQDGIPPWDYHELIALCAPRALLILEPFNDDYNPDVRASMECFHRATQVYALIGCPERASMAVHGDGHGIADDLRAFAYRWFERFLPPGQKGKKTGRREAESV